MAKIPTKAIIKMEHYTNELGMFIEERVLVKGTVKFDRFQGKAMVGIQGPDGQVHGEPITFPIHADTIEDAFASFKDAADLHMKQLHSEMLKQEIAPKRSGLILPG